MDPFTEKLLERTRARRENLQKKMAERPNAASKQMVKRPREPLADTNIVASEPLFTTVTHGSTRPSSSKRRCSGENVQLLNEENQNPLVFQPILSSLSDPPIEKKPPVGPASNQPSPTLDKTPQLVGLNTILSSDCLGVKDAEIAPVILAKHMTEENKIEDPVSSVPGMKSRLQKLVEQRKCWDGDGRADVVSEEKNPSLLMRNSNVPPPVVATITSGTPLGRRGRLANLAATIESWEDDMSHASIAKQNEKEKAGTAVPKFVVRNAPVSATSKTGSPGPPVANIAERCKSSLSSNQSSTMVPRSPQKAYSSASKSAIQSVASSQISNYDTAFQSSPKNEGPLPSATVPHQLQTNLKGSKNVSIPASPMKPKVSSKPDAEGPSGYPEKVNVGSPAGGPLQAKNPSVLSNTSLVNRRLEVKQYSNTTTSYLVQSQKLERESELAEIRNRFQNGKSTRKNKEHAVEATKSSDIKHDKVLGKEVAQCEPLTAKVSREIIDKPAESNVSVAGQGLMLPPPASTSSPLKVLPCMEEGPGNDTPKQQEPVKEMDMNGDVSINSAVINELFGVLGQCQDQNEDALNISSMSLLTPIAETVAAVVNSPESRMMTSTPDGTPEMQRSNIICAASSDTDEVTDEHRLPYSIDVYRSTRVKDIERPKVKQVIVRKENVTNRAAEPTISNLFSIKQKIKILTNEINLQQTVIHQASQALNCCTDEEHGKGSQVEAEAERLLLVATEKREALIAELDRLKGDPKGQKRLPEAPETSSMSPSKGSITLQELRLPLKADFVCSIANKPDSTKHSFFLMIRAKAENILATPLASTHRGLSGDTLTFPTKFTMSDVSSDFEIDIEVYCLVQKHESCGDKKKKPTKSKAITPKRFLAISRSVQTPVVASPGGPNAVRTSNFVLVGSHKLSLASIGKNKFPLEKVPFLCPVEGHIYLKLQCEVGSKVEERGFLTMFEDVSGFGAWHRRWCVLSGYNISYWTYPDDEKHKNPIGHISLANCTSKKVEPANREFCARPNTFELITVRPKREDDKETLVSQCKSTVCVTKNWLSADTKDERNLWIRKLNQTLVDLRVWQPDALFRPL